jgi:hypothetical protein
VSKIDIYYLRIEGDNFLFPSPVQLKKNIGGHKKGDKRDYSTLHNNNDADAIIPS